MCAIPTIAEEDAKRPHRERETLVDDRTSIINRIKATLARLGIRNLNPKLKNAAERLEHVRTPEGEPIPPNTLEELRRDLERKRLVAEQIRQIEKSRLEQLRQAPEARPNLMVLVLMRVIGIGIETADMLVQEVLSRNLRPSRRGALWRAHRVARRKRKEAPREGARPSRECSGAARDGPARVALSRLPKGERLGQVV
jgi:transposase